MREYRKDGTNKWTNISNFSEEDDQKDKPFAEFHGYMDDEEEEKSSSFSASWEEEAVMTENDLIFINSVTSLLPIV